MFEPGIVDVEVVSFLEQLSWRIVEEPHPLVCMRAGKRAADDASESHNEKRTLCDHVYSFVPREYSTDWLNHQPRMRDCRLAASRADLHLLRLRWPFLRSKIDAVGQLAKAVITMLHGLTVNLPVFIAAGKVDDCVLKYPPNGQPSQQRFLNWHFVRPGISCVRLATRPINMWRCSL